MRLIYREVTNETLHTFYCLKILKKENLFNYMLRSVIEYIQNDLLDLPVHPPS